MHACSADGEKARGNKLGEGGYLSCDKQRLDNEDQTMGGCKGREASCQPKDGQRATHQR